MQRKKIFAGLLVLAMIAGVSAAPATDTKLEKQSFTDKVLKSLSSFSLTSTDAGDFTAGEEVNLKADFKIYYLDYTYDPVTTLDVDKVYGGDVFLRIEDPSGNEVHFERIKDYSLSTYALEGETYSWEGSWKIPSDIGGQSGEYQFEIFEGKRLTSTSDEYIIGSTLCSSYEDFNYNGDCYDRITDKQTQGYNIQTGGSDNNPPTADIEWKTGSGGFEVGESGTYLSNADDDNGIQSIRWYIDGTHYSQFDGQNQISSYEWNEAGEHSIKVEVTDLSGLTVTDTFGIKVDKPENEKPSVEITGAKNEYGAGDAVDLSTDANDPDGYITNYEWSIDGRTAEDVSFSFQEAGQHTVSVTVEDDRGATASDSVTFTVVKSNEDPSGETVWVSPTHVETCSEVPADSAPSGAFGSKSECLAQFNGGSDPDKRWVVNNGECIETTSENAVDTTFNTKQNCQSQISDKIFGLNKELVYVGGSVAGAIGVLMFLSMVIIIVAKVS